MATEDWSLAPFDIERTEPMLARVFAKHRKFEPGGYLDWEYFRNPAGNVVALDAVSDQSTVGHYAVIPQKYHRTGETIDVGLSLNTAVRTDARRKGVFVCMASSVYDQAAEPPFSFDAIVAVVNKLSVRGFVERLGWHVVSALPVRLKLTFSRRRKSIASWAATPQFFESQDFQTLCDKIDWRPTATWAQTWSREVLKWRLSKPGQSYTIHANDQLACCVTSTTAFGRRIAVISKFFAFDKSVRANASSLVGAVCNQYQTPFALYIGFNNAVAFHGINVPPRFRASPLYFAYRPLDGRFQVQSENEMFSFECLDFDAY